MAGNLITNKRPELSVLIPVYNAEKTLSAALWSVLNQGFTDLECIVYLDGPTDASAEIVNNFTDDRIKIIEGAHGGIVQARNRLLQEAKGHFIAWLDADDIALPGRFGTQIEYLTTHPELFLVGSWVAVRNGRNTREVKWPVNPKILDAWLFYRNPLVQSSVLFRNPKNSVLLDPEMEYLEDYDFYRRYMGKACIGITPAVLCSYLEVSEKSRVSTYLKYDFVGKLEKIMAQNFGLLGLTPGSYDLSLIRDFLRSNKSVSMEDGKKVMSFLKSAIKANREKNVLETTAFESVSTFQLMRLWKCCAPLRGSLLKYFIFHIPVVVRAVKSRPIYR